MRMRRRRIIQNHVPAEIPLAPVPTAATWAEAESVAGAISGAACARRLLSVPPVSVVLAAIVLVLAALVVLLGWLLKASVRDGEKAVPSEEKEVLFGAAATVDAPNTDPWPGDVVALLPPDLLPPPPFDAVPGCEPDTTVPVTEPPVFAFPVPPEDRLPVTSEACTREEEMRSAAANKNELSMCGCFMMV
jgi:hypothetical protein